MSSRVLVALRIAAPRERVFEAFTREIHLWWRPHPMFLFSPASGRDAGDRAGARRPVHRNLCRWNVVRDRPRHAIGSRARGSRLTWRQASFKEGQVTEVDIRFETVGAETRVTVEHRGWDSIPAGHVARHGMPDTLFLQRHGQYWQALLATFKQEVEANSATYNRDMRPAGICA